MTFASRTGPLFPFAVTLALAGGASGCNDLLGIGEPIPAETTGTGGTGAGGTGGAGGATTSTTGGGGSATTDTGGGGAGGATTTSTPCPTTTKTLIAKEDMCIFENACGSISPGADPECNLGFGRGLFRFVVPPEVVTAFRQGAVVELSLTISRQIDCGICQYKTAGPLEARPLRNDWYEGTGAGYSGAEWCRRTAEPPGDKWQVAGASGALDVGQGEPSGTVEVDTVVPSFTIPLDPAAHESWIGNGLDGQPSLSVRVSRPVGTETVFIMAAHEGSDPSKIAQLAVTYCQ